MLNLTFDDTESFYTVPKHMLSSGRNAHQFIRIKSKKQGAGLMTVNINICKSERKQL